MKRFTVIVRFTHYYCLKKQFWADNKVDEQTKFKTKFLWPRLYWPIVPMSSWIELKLCMLILSCFKFLRIKHFLKTLLGFLKSMWNLMSHM